MLGDRTTLNRGREEFTRLTHSAQISYIYSFHPRPGKELGQQLIIGSTSILYERNLPVPIYIHIIPLVPIVGIYHTQCLYYIYICIYEIKLIIIPIRVLRMFITQYVRTYRHARLAEKYDLPSGPPMRALGTLLDEGLSHQFGLNRDRRKSRTMRVLCNGIRRLPMTVIMHIRTLHYYYVPIYENGIPSVGGREDGGASARARKQYALVNNIKASRRSELLLPKKTRT